MEDNSLAIRGSGDFGLMDYTSALGQASDNIKAIRKYVEDNFKEGVDYGPPFPGGDKPTLLLPGAQKFNLLFNARPEYAMLHKVEDYNTGFCLYHFQCRLVNRASGTILGEGEGSCNSFESKYRWRRAERTCPVCGKVTIKKSRFPPREDPSALPGWYCYDKIGGCGANFSAKAPEIVQQEVGNVPNPDIFDTWNTVLKMAMKRAMVSAAHSTGGVGDLFTQDAEDFVDGNTGEIIEAKVVTRAATKHASPAATKPTPTVAQPTAHGVSIDGADESDVEMIEVHDPKTEATFPRPANGYVDRQYAGAFCSVWIGSENVFKAKEHLANHLKKYYEVVGMGKMTWRQMVILYNYCLAESGASGGGYDPVVYKDKLASAGGPVRDMSKLKINAEGAETDTNAILELWHAHLNPADLGEAVHLLNEGANGVADLSDDHKRLLWQLGNAVSIGNINRDGWRYVLEQDLKWHNEHKELNGVQPSESQ